MIITVATGNPHKIVEMDEINPYKNIQLKCVEGDFDPVEDGETFEQNAYIKAKTASLMIKDFAFADDSGLCVDYLNGAPGLHSARYAPTRAEKIEKLLSSEISDDTINNIDSFVVTKQWMVFLLKKERQDLFAIWS